MTEADDSLILDILRKLQARQGDMMLCLGNLEEASASMSGRIASIEVALAGVNKRLDRFDHRLDRIKTRLGLIEA